MIVADVDAIYLPECPADGEDAFYLPLHDSPGQGEHPAAPAEVLPLSEPMSPGELFDLADDLGVGFDGHELGVIYLSPRLCDHYGLRIPSDLTAAVEAIEDEEIEHTSKIRRVVYEQLSEASVGLVDDAAKAGWEIPSARADMFELRPRFRVRRPDRTDPKRTRVMTVVVGLYSRLWDSRGQGPDRADLPLPDAYEDPAGYCSGMATRMARLTRLLEVQWRATAGLTGQAVADGVKARNPLNGPGLRPDLSKSFALTKIASGQSVLEPLPSWTRPNGLPERELAEAGYVHAFDTRGAWLSRLGQLPLGSGTPTYFTGEDAQRWVVPRKIPYAYWRVVLPCWDHPFLPPPHPWMRPDEEVVRWITTPSLQLLVDLLKWDIKVVEAWVWLDEEGNPSSHRYLEAWYNRIRLARQRAENGAAMAAARAGDARQAQDAELVAYWETEAYTWSAILAVIKSVYTAYIGRLNSVYSLKQNAAYQHHHQPHWNDSIRASQRCMDWWKVYCFAEGEDGNGGTRNYPIELSGTDAWFFLSDSADPASVAPQEDDGKLGKLRSKQAPVELTDELRAELRGNGRRPSSLFFAPAMVGEAA